MSGEHFRDQQNEKPIGDGVQGNRVNLTFAEVMNEPGNVRPELPADSTEGRFKTPTTADLAEQVKGYYS